MQKALVCTALLIASGAVPLRADTLSLYTFHAPPFQIEPAAGTVPYAVTGTTLETIECVTSRMGWDTRIRAVPQNRAIHALTNHTIDGYFAVRESSQLEPFARATDPVALEKWHLYSLGPIEDYRHARIGVVAGSNEATWLVQNGLDVHMQVSSTSQLLAILDRGRVDAILLDQHVMRTHLSDQPAGERQRPELESRFVQFASLHLYLSREFLAFNQPFLAGFNYHLPGCIKTEFQLDQHEADKVKALARLLLESLERDRGLAAHLINHVPYSSLEEILAFDRAWLAHAPDRHSALAVQLLATPTSQGLAEWQGLHGGLITEVFAMDEMGAITALSELTSDFWQGDERKFQATVSMAAGEVHLSPVHFDHSSRRFQVIASMPVRLHPQGRFIGAVAVGLDLERALDRATGILSPFALP